MITQCLINSPFLGFAYTAEKNILHFSEKVFELSLFSLSKLSPKREKNDTQNHILLTEFRFVI